MLGQVIFGFAAFGQVNSDEDRFGQDISRKVRIGQLVL
jgi:hypothetical protein